MVENWWISASFYVKIGKQTKLNIDSVYTLVFKSLSTSWILLLIYNSKSYLALSSCMQYRNKMENNITLVFILSVKTTVYFEQKNKNTVFSCGIINVNMQGILISISASELLCYQYKWAEISVFLLLLSLSLPVRKILCLRMWLL